MGIERLGDILLLDRLANGGMAEIFRAKQYGLNGFEKTIAVKRILPNFTLSTDFQEMFKAEANLSAQLQHPNIAQVFSNGQHGGYLFIVMEYVEGKNLRHVYLKSQDNKKPTPIPFICYVVCEAAKGLDYAHNFVDEKSGEPLQIIHRDVNHQNIVLSYEGAVKIIDFGVAKAQDEDRHKTKAGLLKGKVSYMSPEQVRGRKIDRRTDIFSLGIVLWEMLADRHLFMQDTEIETLEYIRECKVPFFKDIGVEVPEELERIARKALEKDPANRYLNAKEFFSDLQNFLNQKYPGYFQSDVASYLKEIFKEEIVQERARKEKINQETKAYLAKNPMLRGSANKILADDLRSKTEALVPNSANTVADFQDKTIASVQTNIPAGFNDRISQSKVVPGWTQSSSSVSGTRFQYDQGSNTSVYSSAVQGHSAKLVGILLVVAIGVIYMFFKERERLLYASYESSRTEKWTESFKGSFISSCSSENVVASEYNKVEFCMCLTTAVENAKILYTKFNPNVISEEAHSQVNLVEFRKFMNSPAGEEAKYACLGKMAGN
jgi:serine/threonine-protein kinase